MTTNHLPSAPSYQEACDILDHKPLEFWLPLLNQFRQDHVLGDGEWQRINAGGNALFELSKKYVVKIVPPNWSRQGDTELAAAKFLRGKTSLPTPEIIGGGHINGWVYIIMTMLPGRPLSDVWGDLNIEQKVQIITQVGTIARELQLPPAIKEPHLSVDWGQYLDKQECIARHRRNQLAENLLSLVLPFIERYKCYFLNGEAKFAHMDLHPWNLMIEIRDNHWHISGVIDLGDAMFTHDPLFDCLTPAIFLAQGNSQLLKALLESYKILPAGQDLPLDKLLMAYALVRPDSNINFVLEQVPHIDRETDWEHIATQLFPL